MKFREKYAFLSNFYDAPVIFRGKYYPTSEHAYQAAKFTDENIQEEIRRCSTPGQSKRLARRYADRIVDNWNDVKKSIMYSILCEKFKHPELKRKLLEVDEPIVEENNWGDTYWGVCDGEGENHLGKILTRIKREIQVFDNDT